jgi:hypothetical protein
MKTALIEGSVELFRKPEIFFDIRNEYAWLNLRHKAKTMLASG